MSLHSTSFFLMSCCENWTRLYQSVSLWQNWFSNNTVSPQFQEPINNDFVRTYCIPLVPGLWEWSRSARKVNSLLRFFKYLTVGGPLLYHYWITHTILSGGLEICKDLQSFYIASKTCSNESILFKKIKTCLIFIVLAKRLSNNKCL